MDHPPVVPAVPAGRPNPDRVARPVAGWAGVGVLLAGVGQALLDGVIDPVEGRGLYGEAGAFLLVLLPALTAWYGARRARANVTPIRTDLGDQPRDQHFQPLTVVWTPPGPGETYRGQHERDR
jgi:hypothetical protein